MKRIFCNLLSLLLVLVFFLQSCRQKAPVPDKDNGGLWLPNGFGALVVADSAGTARHLAVNSNGDIYVKLRSSNKDSGNIALRCMDT